LFFGATCHHLIAHFEMTARSQSENKDKSHVSAIRDGLKKLYILG